MSILRAEGDWLRPSFSYTDAARHPQVSSRGGASTVSLSRRVTPWSARTFTLTWTGAAGTEGQKYLLEKAWATSVGAVKAMTFTPLDEDDTTAVQVAFVGSSLSISRTGFRTWEMSVQVEEVL